MRRKDDDIAVHRDAPLKGILYTSEKRKKLPKPPVLPAHAAPRKPLLPALRHAAAAPFLALSSVIKKIFKHEPRDLPPVKAEFKTAPLPGNVQVAPPAPGISRVLSKSSEAEKQALKSWPLAVTCAGLRPRFRRRHPVYPPRVCRGKEKRHHQRQRPHGIRDHHGPRRSARFWTSSASRWTKTTWWTQDKNAAVSDDMQIVIRRAMSVTVSTMDGEKEIEMVAGTVDEALKKAGVAVDKNDEVYPRQDTFVQPDMKIQVVRVETKYETKNGKR